MMLKTKNMKHLKSFEADLDKEETFLDISLSKKQKERSLHCKKHGEW